MEEDNNGGLLGFLKTPEGLGLLGTVFGGLAGAKRGQPLNSLGRAGLAGSLAYGYGLNRDEKAKQAALAAGQETANMNAIRNAFIPTSGGNAMSDGQGPTIANAAKIGQQPKPFTPGGFLADNPNVPLAVLKQAMDLNESMRPKTAAPRDIDPNKPFTLGPNGEIIPNQQYQDYERSKPREQAQPYYTQAVDAERGMGTFNNRTGHYEFPSSPLVKPGDSPDLQGRIAGAKASGKETGQATGENAVKLQDMESMMPRLETVTAELSDLGKKATYTMVGQGANFARRQLGMGVGEGAIARKEYISKVDNEILPLLRQTFGAQFTQKEGESLKQTLGDTNASPEEKDAVLKSFIETKYGQIAGLKRRAGQPSAQPKAAKTVVKTGVYNGKKVNQYSDGSTDYAN